MTKKGKLGSAKRFGARYGRSLRHLFAKIEDEHRRKHKCPYCGRIAVKRLAAGIWLCKKCGSKFTGKAYTISKNNLIVEEKND
ncbi:50S ribosomal protein L37ae [Candidatus Woesearchaeota archaeon]|nr:50S ribosomal protein L37ae [Candidatus Woesearchaeota archaeon]